MQGTVSTANGVTKTHLYYPRPRSFSAGSQSVVLASNKRLSAPLTGLSVTPAVKVVRLNTSAAKAYGKAKSLEEGKRALASPTTTSTLRYKTELCRPFLDNGFCKYGDKCQFAHGEQDLRSLPRHPKYKTELCRTYHTRGFCPYGSRCHFIHSVDETRKNQVDGLSGGGTGPIKSPTKKTMSFTMPLSPSLDSGISSPDEYQRGRYFDFPGNDHSSGSGSEGDLCDLEQSLEHESCFVPPYNSSGQEIVSSPDTYMELDIFSMGRESPTKPMPVGEKMKKTTTDDFPSEVCNMQDLLLHMSIEERRPTPGSVSAQSGCHRLPVFDNILNTKSDAALLEMNAGAEVKSPSKLFRFFNNAA